MKFATILLALLLVVLSCLPCADAERPAHGDHSLALGENHTDHPNEHSDLCSPFCICNCCGAQILNFTAALVLNFEEISFLNNTQLTITYKSQFASMFSGSIWQPPQIV